MIKTYIFLIGAILCEVAGTMLLPASQNFTKFVPTFALAILGLLLIVIGVILDNSYTIK